MKHRNSEMIIAKAENAELVVFIKYVDGWKESGFLDLITLDNPFFLCLPKHRKAVLCALNGGVAQAESGGETIEHALKYADWSDDDWYMSEDFKSRIKPRKEKRWVGVYTENGVTTGACMSLEEAQHHPMVRECLLSDWQIIEIEVEV